MDNSVHHLRTERAQDLIISSNKIFFLFGLLYHFLIMLAVLSAILMNGNESKLHILFGTLVFVLVCQTVTFPKLKNNIIYARLTIVLSCIVFTMINLISSESIYLILFLPMCVLCILYFDKTFTLLICIVGLMNGLIQLAGMLSNPQLMQKENISFMTITFTCAMFSIAIAMVNKMVGGNYEDMLKDLKKENKLQRKFYVKSNFDTTTDLMNRNAYNEYLDHFENESMQSVCCIYIDVNGLHEYNNTFGHLEGDHMLNRVATGIKNCFDGDKAYRIGGDEFVVICENTIFREVLLKLKAFREEMHKNKIHVAIGMEWRDDNMNIIEMIKAADVKMYQDKEKFYELYPKGRNSAVLYERAVK